METIELKTNMHCEKCINKVEPVLKMDNNVTNWRFDMKHSDKLIIVDGDNIDVDNLINQIDKVGYTAEVRNKGEKIPVKTLIVPKISFWKSAKNWKRASFNTFNCLIGCTIGDFGMIIFLQAYFLGTSMAMQMILAIIAGLLTSIMLETIILRKKERFEWITALKTAFSMSFISMIGMELAMNFTDFMFTGGKANFESLTYWIAFIPAVVMGFLFPLPYNYYKLQKHGKSCH
jgi:cation transport ATPase